MSLSSTAEKTGPLLQYGILFSEYFRPFNTIFSKYFHTMEKVHFSSDQLKCYPAIEVCKRHRIKSRIQCTLGNFIFPFNNINLLWVSYFLLFCLRVPRLLLFSVVPIIGSFILYLIWFDLFITCCVTLWNVLLCYVMTWSVHDKDNLSELQIKNRSERDLRSCAVT